MRGMLLAVAVTLSWALGACGGGGGEGESESESESESEGSEVCTDPNGVMADCHGGCELRRISCDRVDVDACTRACCRDIRAFDRCVDPCTQADDICGCELHCWSSP